MRRDSTFQFGLPRFQGAVRHIVLLNFGIWLALMLLWVVDRPAAGLLMVGGSLDPVAVKQGWVWQFLTYAFIHPPDPRYLLSVLVGVYFIGSSVEERIGPRAFIQLYLGSSILAGVVGFLLSMTGHVGSGVAMGGGAAANAILMVFYLFYRGTSIYLFPLPFQIPVQWVVIGFGILEGAFFILSNFGLFYLVSLLGLGAGYLWYRFAWRRASLLGPIRNPFADLRNNYYRWKRRRAAKKFQVYMRKHGQDPKEYFDEYGNFRPPDDKKDGGRWIN